MTELSATGAIATPQPKVPESVAAHVLAREFGLAGRLEPLLSERDQNFRLRCDDGRQFVVKIANAAEPELTTDFQIRALQFIEQQHCPVATPIIRRTLHGSSSTLLREGGATHLCRVVGFVSGTPLSAIVPGAAFAEDFGRSTALLDLALQNFTHPGDRQVLLWDLQRAGALRSLLVHVEDEELHDAVRQCIDDFDRRVQPVLPSLRHQVIHADLNADNVLVKESDHDAVAGFIDFGDMLRAPLIMEVAIACAYLRGDGSDPLRLLRPFVAGFHRVLPLTQKELGLLYDLLRARLAATITILRWRLAKRGDGDAYASHFMGKEETAGTFLLRLQSLGHGAFTDGIREAIEKQ